MSKSILDSYYDILSANLRAYSSLRSLYSIVLPCLGY